MNRCWTCPLLALALVGCATGGAKKIKAGDAASPTGGVAILYEERDLHQNRFRLYELRPDGTLGVGGGVSARDGKVDWTGALGAEEIKAILSAADNAGLRHQAPPCNSGAVEGGDVRVFVEYATPGASRRYDLEGQCPTLKPLRDAFEQAGLQRFKQQLDALPEPGPQKRRTPG